MKKIISIAYAAILAGLAISCQKEEAVSDKTDAVQYTFNITVNDRAGFDNDASTKGSESHKTLWENGDKIYLFFKPTTDDNLLNTYATLTYDGSSWNGQLTGESSLGTGGTLSAVYVYKLGDVTPEFDADKWTIATGNTFYNCDTGETYTVSGNNEISANLNLVAPTNFVQFYIEGATGALTCDKVKGWKDIAIGSDMAVSNVTCTGYMNGFTNIGDQNVKEYYGRIVNNGISLKDKDCKFSVVKDGKVCERTAVPSSNARSFKMSTNAEGDKTWTKAEDKLPGLFTVSKGTDGEAGTEDDVQVRFSKGNLYYDGNNFAFEAKQYYFRTYYKKPKYDENGYKLSGTASDHWGLFGWVGSSSTKFSSSPEKYGVSTSTTDSHYGNNTSDVLQADWGKVIDDANTWRTLTRTEWQCLFNDTNYTSEVRNGKYKYGVKVCDAGNCVVIAPDDWNLTEHPIQTEYDASAWTTAEYAGLVCLPAGGYRTGSNVNEVKSSGYYWSSTASTSSKELVNSVAFTSKTVHTVYGGNRHLGYSVRLITDVK